MIYAQQVELYDATSDAMDFLITVMVPLLAISLFETKRQTERNIFTLLDDFIIYSSFLVPLIYFYFYSIRTGTTHTLNFAVACSLFFAIIILLFEFLFFMKDDYLKNYKKFCSIIYAFILSVNVFELGIIFKTNTVVKKLDPYVITAICDGHQVRCNLATALLIIAVISSLLLLILPISKAIGRCYLTSFYVKLSSTLCHAVIISMVTLVVGWTLSNSEYVTKIVLAIGTLSITRIINRFRDFEVDKIINTQGQEEIPKRILLSHFLFDFDDLLNENIEEKKDKDSKQMV